MIHMKIVLFCRVKIGLSCHKDTSSLEIYYIAIDTRDTSLKYTSKNAEKKLCIHQNVFILVWFKQ